MSATADAAWPLVAATYNVHGWVGTDGRSDPGRTLRVVRELGADLVGLQEAALATDDAPATSAPRITAAWLAAETGLQVVAGPLLLRRGHHVGNVLLTRLPILRVARHDLSVPGHEPRGLLDVTVQAPRAPLRVLVTHFGLRYAERHRQARRLMEIVHACPPGRALLLGDLNQWLPFTPALHPIHRWFGPAPARRSFPARLPLLALDRLWLGPRERLAHVRAHRSPVARVASDHLPVRALVPAPAGAG